MHAWRKDILRTWGYNDHAKLWKEWNTNCDFTRCDFDVSALYWLLVRAVHCDGIVEDDAKGPSNGIVSSCGNVKEGRENEDSHALVSLILNENIRI